MLLISENIRILVKLKTQITLQSVKKVMYQVMAKNLGCLCSIPARVILRVHPFLWNKVTSVQSEPVVIN